jgi:hypothetical protein
MRGLTLRRGLGWRGGLLVLAAGAALCPLAIGFSRFYNVGCQSERYPTIYLEWPPILQGGGAINGGMYINPNCADAGCPDTSERDAIIRAMETWNEAPFHFTFIYSGDTTALPYDGTYDIELSDEVSVSGWNPIDGPGGLLARAWVFFECWGEIVETDIEFDDSQDWDAGGELPADEFDLESVALHELGHCLGLDHSPAPAIMQPSFSPGEKRLVLTQDDIDGGIAIYGPPPSAVDGFEEFR